MLTRVYARFRADRRFRWEVLLSSTALLGLIGGLWIVTSRSAFNWIGNIPGNHSTPGPKFSWPLDDPTLIVDNVDLLRRFKEAKIRQKSYACAFKIQEEADGKVDAALSRMLKDSDARVQWLETQIKDRKLELVLVPGIATIEPFSEGEAPSKKEVHLIALRDIYMAIAKSDAPAAKELHLFLKITILYHLDDFSSEQLEHIVQCFPKGNVEWDAPKVQDVKTKLAQYLPTNANH